MSLDLYHVVAPSEARLELVYELLGTYRVTGARSARVWFRNKILLFYFIPMTFICIFFCSNITYHGYNYVACVCDFCHATLNDAERTLS